MVMQYHERSTPQVPPFSAETQAAELARLRRAEQHFRVVNRFASMLLRLNTVDDIIWAVARHAIEELGFVDCVVYLLEPERGRLVQRAVWSSKIAGRRKLVHPMQIAIGRGIVGAAAKTGRIQLVPDTRIDPRYIVDDEPRLSELAVPIKDGERILGVIDSEHPDTGFFSKEDCETLSAIAAMAAARLVHAISEERRQLALAELERANTAKSVFLASMSHELRTPLSIMLSRTQMLKMGVYGQLSGVQKEQIGIIETGGNRLQSLFDNLFLYTELVAGSVQLNHSRFSIETLLYDVLEQVTSQAATELITVAVSTKAGGVLSGDRDLLMRMLCQLTHNAIKFTEAGGVVELSAEQDGNSLTVHVMDSGIGIPRDEINRIFLPFEQLDSSLARLHEGAGLGLTIVREIVDLHYGSVHVDSSTEAGTRFSITLPVTPPF